MKLAIITSLIASTYAFTTPAVTTAATKSTTTTLDALATKADLVALAEKSNPIVKYYDPLQLASTTIYGESQEATIAWLRQAEIKHGRVAMAAFVGYCVQSNGIHFPALPPGMSGFQGSPPEQWDALPDAAKWQIILFVGFLEWFSESAGTHYMRGGRPGEFPKFSDHSDLVPHPVPFNLFDPFGLSSRRSPESKERGLISELNNGRLAMIGIFGFMAEQKVDGAVPLLKGVVPHYDGEFMGPFLSGPL